MSEPVGHRDVLELLHSESIAAHGGADGLRDEGLFESALSRPQNLFAYEGATDVARLAASYAFGLAKNHAFIDGNKRVAFIAAVLFLRLNGHRLTANPHRPRLRCCRWPPARSAKMKWPPGFGRTSRRFDRPC